VKQRWIVVFSEKTFARETKTLEKKIKKEKERVERGMASLQSGVLQRGRCSEGCTGER